MSDDDRDIDIESDVSITQIENCNFSFKFFFFLIKDSRAKKRLNLLIDSTTINLFHCYRTKMIPILDHKTAPRLMVHSSFLR